MFLDIFSIFLLIRVEPEKLARQDQKLVVYLYIFVYKWDEERVYHVRTMYQDNLLHLLFFLSVTCDKSVVFSCSPNQAKWATSSPWFQWSRPISVKKRSFSRPVSFFKSVFFSPIIILFLQYSHKRSSHVPEMWPIHGLMFNILFQTR
jgi:hypothetical protein